MTKPIRLIEYWAKEIKCAVVYYSISSITLLAP